MKTRTITEKIDYTYYVIDFLNDLGRAIDVLKDVEFDTIVGRGLSGGLVIPSLAKVLNDHFASQSIERRIGWAVVRKPNDESHSDSPIEGTTFGERWIFVDDFVCSGNTRKLTKTAVKDYATRYDFGTEYVGSYLYRHAGVFVPVSQEHHY